MHANVAAGVSQLHLHSLFFFPTPLRLVTVSHFGERRSGLHGKELINRKAEKQGRMGGWWKAMSAGGGGSGEVRYRENLGEGINK